MIALSVIGFLVIDPSARVHTKFDLDGWTVSYTRNTALLVYVGAGLLTAGALALSLKMNEGIPWLRWLAVGVMTLLPVVELLAIIHAAN